MEHWDLKWMIDWLIDVNLRDCKLCIMGGLEIKEQDKLYMVGKVAQSNSNVCLWSCRSNEYGALLKNGFMIDFSPVRLF